MHAARSGRSSLARAVARRSVDLEPRGEDLGSKFAPSSHMTQASLVWLTTWTERRAAACIQAAARATLARKTRAAARLQEVLRVKLAPLHAAATRVQAAARGLLARRWLALAVAAAELNLAAITIQRAALPFITCRLTAAIAQLCVRLAAASSLGQTDILSQLAQRASGLTMVTEHTGKAAAGQMRGGKAATSAAGAKNRRDHDNDMMKYLASLSLRAGLAPATMALGALFFPLVMPAAEFNGDQCEALELAIVRRMACVEAESRELAWAVHNAVHAEYNYFIQEVRGFSQEEIICDTPDYFTGLARRLSDYLKNVDSTPSMSSSGGMPSPTASAAPTRRRGGAGTFSWGATTSPSPTSSRRRCVASAADRCKRRRSRPPSMINSDSGWHHCLLNKKDESETDSWSDTDEESGRDDDF